MVFSSLSFLFLFFPVTFLLHTVVPNWKFRNALLIITSLVFYAWGEPLYVLLLLFSVVVNWALALAVAGREKGRKALAAVAVVWNIGLLVVFKYSGFLGADGQRLLGMDWAVPSIRLPIGISFFTFQALSYVIDVYRDRDCRTAQSAPAAAVYLLLPPANRGPHCQISRYPGAACGAGALDGRGAPRGSGGSCTDWPKRC